MSSLVGIGKERAAQAKPLPALVPFFVVGLLSGLLGTTWLGVHLWMMLNGQMDIPPNYVALRSAHALIQIHLFIGLFIVGFCIHAGPHLLHVTAKVPRLSGWLVAPAALGGLLLFHDASSALARFLIAVPFFAGALNFAWLMRRAEYLERLRIGAPMLACLLVLGFAAFAPLDQTRVAVHVVWHGVGLSIFSAGQQFISGFLGGKRMPERPAKVFLALCGLSFVCSLAALPSGSPLALRAFAVANLAAICSYALATGLANHRRVRYWPMALAFWVATGWAAIGNAILLFDPALVDFALHSWAIGWAMTLVIATSVNILGFMSGRPVSPRAMVALVTVWQLVPLGRGLGFFPINRGVTSTLVGIAAGVVVVAWGWILIGRASSIRKGSIPAPAGTSAAR